MAHIGGKPPPLIWQFYIDPIASPTHIISALKAPLLVSIGIIVPASEPIIFFSQLVDHNGISTSNNNNINNKGVAGCFNYAQKGKVGLVGRRNGSRGSSRKKKQLRGVICKSLCVSCS